MRISRLTSPPRLLFLIVIAAVLAGPSSPGRQDAFASPLSTETMLPNGQSDASPNAFVMRVNIVMGGGYGRLPDGTIGEVRQFDLIGELLQGAPPAPDSQGVLGRKDGRVLAVNISSSSQLPDGRVSVSVDQVDLPDVNGAYVLGSDRSVLSAVPVPTPVPGQPTAVDAYADYVGPPLRYSTQPVDDVDVEILVRLARAPSSDEAASLERAISAWDEKGIVDGFGTAMYWGGAGRLHGLSRDSQFGPRWTRETLRWLGDFGTADAQIAEDDLARRLAGWSSAHGVSIVELNFGQWGTR